MVDNNGNGWKNWTRICAAAGMVIWPLFLKWCGFQASSVGLIFAAGVVEVALLFVTAGKSGIEKALELLKALVRKNGKED